MRLYRWRRKARVSAYMLSAPPVGYAEHLQWLEATLRDARRSVHIFGYGDRPLGQLNALWTGAESAEIGYYIGEDDAPRGSGVVMLHLGMTDIFEKSGAANVFAKILSENERSLRLIARMRFSLVRTESHDGRAVLVFALSQSDFLSQRKAIWADVSSITAG